MTRISVNERGEEAWRRPVKAQAEETYDLTTQRRLEAFSDGRFVRSVLWTLDGAEQLEDLDRLTKGVVCSQCLEPFPAKPGLDTISEFRRVYGDKPEPIRSNWQSRVAMGCCPICASEVDTSMFEALHRGTLPPPTRIDE